MQSMVRSGYVTKNATRTSVTFTLTERGSQALRAELSMPLFDAVGINDLPYGRPLDQD